MIAPVTLSDLDEIRAVIAAAIRASVAGSEEKVWFLAEDVEKSLEWWKANPSRTIHLKSVVGDQIAGVILVKNGWNLTNLFVRPDFYRSGVATQLLQRVVEECSPISPKGGLRVNSSTFAVPLYEKFGFRQTGEGVERPGGCVPMTYDFQPPPPP